MKMKMKIFEKMSLIFKLSTSKLDYKEIFMKICGKIFLTHSFRHFWLVKAKTKMKMKKYFWFLHINIRLCGSFPENLRKKFLTHFLRHFWLIKKTIKMKMKKYGKIISIFEFSRSKLSYVTVFIKIWEKIFRFTF